MPQKLSITAQNLVQNTVKTPNIVVDIEGVDDLYGSQAILEFIKWDQENPEVFWDQDGIFWDGLIENETSKSFIDLGGTTKSVAQQIFPDKQGASSVSSVNIKIIDKDRIVSKTLSFNSITEILGKKCNLAYGFSEGEYPKDYLYIYRGVVTDYYWQGGAVHLTVASPETLKRQSIFKKVVTKLDGALNASDTTFNVVDASEFLESNSDNSFNVYLRIDDEILRVISKTATSFTVDARGSILDTSAASHSDEAEVESFYILGEDPTGSDLDKGNPIDLALKLMLSGTGEVTGSISLESFVYVDGSLSIPNSIIFDTDDFQRDTGLVIGDTISITSGVNTGSYLIESFNTLEDGRSYITVEVISDLIEVTNALGTTYTYRSQYDVLPDGLEMLPIEVDVAGFQFEKDLNNLTLTNEMRFFLKDSLDDPKEFIDKELLFNSGFYSIPKNAKVSVKSFTPPLTIDDTPTLDTSNILNLSNLSLRRSGHRYLYNRIDFVYNEDVLEDRFLAYFSTLNSDSIDRIKLGKKALRVESKGYPDLASIDTILTNITKRYLDRFKFASTYIENIQLNFKAGFNLEVGDVVFFGGGDTKLVNFETGERDLEARKYEIVNKKLDLSGNVAVSLVDTGFAIEGIYGVISPSLKITSATTTDLTVTKVIPESDQFTFARDAFTNLVGVKVRVYSPDYSYDEITTLIELPEGRPNVIKVTALPSAPLSDYIVELAPINELTANTPLNDFVKLKYVFNNKYNQSVTGYPGGNDISVADASGFSVGDFCHIYSPGNYDFTDENYCTIANISGNTITINDFSPGINLGIVGDILETRSYSTTEIDGYFLL